MKKVVFAIIQLLFASIAFAETPSSLKHVRLDEFMHGQLSIPIELPIPIPIEYEWAAIPKAPFTYSYWMRPGDLPVALKSGDLPSEGGYMYGKISLDVGYDSKRDLFIGIEDLGSLQKLSRAFPNAKLERLRYKGHPVLLATLTDPSSNKVVYSMYVGLNISTNAVYVALRPPSNSKEVGDHIWTELKSAIAKADSK